MVKRVLTTVLLLLFILSPLAAIEAKTVVTPFKNEVLLSGGERLKQSVNLRNDGDSPINVSPIVFSYDPQNQALLDTSMYVFVKTDKEIFTIPARSSLNFNYEIIPPANLVPGDRPPPASAPAPRGGAQPGDSVYRRQRQHQQYPHRFFRRCRPGAAAGDELSQSPLRPHRFHLFAHPSRRGAHPHLYGQWPPHPPARGGFTRRGL